MQGTTVENICFELRYLPDTRSLAKDHALLLLCDLSFSNPDAVEVAIVSEQGLEYEKRFFHMKKPQTPVLILVVVFFLSCSLVWFTVLPARGSARPQFDPGDRQRYCGHFV